MKKLTTAGVVGDKKQYFLTHFDQILINSAVI